VALTPEVARAREAGLAAAVGLFQATHISFQITVGYSPQSTIVQDPLTEIRSNAEVFAAWVLGTTHLAVIRGSVVSQATGQSTGTSNQGDSMQIHDDEKVTLSVDTKDAKGFETADAVSWTIDDGSVASLTVSEDGRSCTVVANVPGSAVVTVADADAGLSATEAIDVVAGGTATITVVEGDVTKQ
jgi:hypothetical protein